MILNLNYFIAFKLIIVLCLAFTLSATFASYAGSDVSISQLTDEVQEHIAKHRPLWPPNCQDRFTDAIRCAFNHAGHIEPEKMQVFLQSFDDYLSMFPEKVNDEDIRYICSIVKQHSELFLSGNRPKQGSLEALWNQVEYMARSIQENIFDVEQELPQNSKDRAIESFMKSFSKISMNPLYPGLKRPLTSDEIDFIKRIFPLNLDIPTNPTSKTPEWQLKGFNTMLWFVDKLTTPRNDTQREVTVPKRVLKSLRSGEEMYLSWTASSIDSVILSEVFTKEIVSLYYLVRHTSIHNLLIYFKDETSSGTISDWQSREIYYTWSGGGTKTSQTATVWVSVNPRITVTVDADRPIIHIAVVDSYAFSRAFATKNSEGSQVGSDEGEIDGDADASGTILGASWSITISKEPGGTITYNGSGDYNSKSDTVGVSLGGQLTFQSIGPKITLSTSANCNAHQRYGDYASANAEQDVNQFDLRLDDP